MKPPPSTGYLPCKCWMLSAGPSQAGQVTEMVST
jgi:hypothetical protein